jgi:hypothetical protein
MLKNEKKKPNPWHMCVCTCSKLKFILLHMSGKQLINQLILNIQFGDWNILRIFTTFFSM